MKRFILIVCLFASIPSHGQNFLTRLGEAFQRQNEIREARETKDTPEPVKLALVDITYNSSDYVPIKSPDGLWGYKQLNSITIKPRFQQAGPFTEGLAAVQLGGKFGYIDKGGICSIPYRYENAGVFAEGLARVAINGKYGYIDKTGKQIIPYKFSDAGDFINGLAEVILNGKKGYIDKTGEWFDDKTEVLQSFSSFARQFVETNVNEWQKKGKYEKTLAWQERVNEKTRAKIVDSLLEVAKFNYIEYQKSKIKLDYKLGDYDADGEVFIVHDARFGNLLIQVPINEAEAFEKEFVNISRIDKYCVAGDGIGLTEAVFKTSTGKSYYYNNNAALEFASVDIEYNFDSIDVEMETPAMPTNNMLLKKKNISVGKSDIDLGIPESNIINNNKFAVIIANEDYQRVSHVEFAANDGQIFKEYCNKTLGLPEKNIRLIQNATLVNMWEQVDWLTGVAKAYKGDAEIIFYYAGHGVPDEATKDAYLLPVDGNGANAATGYKLSELYSKLSANPTKSTLVLLDACFSGAERSGDMMVAARGVAIKAKTEAPKGNMVVFSAAQGDETAYPYREKGHGLFTYFLCKKLQETGGNVTLGDLASYISDNVVKHSMIENSKSQTPSVNASGIIAETWKTISLK